ncbi:hypothetical protein LMG1864_04112 [Achromobacter ruhlandii]|nr:hypothetical protein LMG1864_04112 [Achromobacter ruhlandii]
MEVVRQAAFAEIEPERADHAAVARLDGRGPAGLDVFRQRQVAIVVPQRVGGDIGHDHRPPQEGRGAAGAGPGADGLALQRVGVGRRHAWRGQGPQLAGLVHPQHGGRDFGRQALDLAADHVHHLDHRGLIDHRLQHAALQHFVHLGGRDVGQHIDDVDQRAALVEHRVGHHRYPQRLAAAVIDQHVLVIALAAGDAAVQFLAGATVGAAAGQQLAQFLPERIGARKAQHALEAIVDVDDSAVAPGHGHGIAGFVDPQQQQADLFLAFRIGDGLARDDRNAAHFAALVAHRQIGGLDPQRRAAAGAIAAGAGEEFAATQAGPDLFGAGDALAFVHAVAQQVVAQAGDIGAGIVQRGQEVVVRAQQRTGGVEVEQQQRPVHRRQIVAHLPRGALRGHARTAWMRIKHKGLHTGRQRFRVHSGPGKAKRDAVASILLGQVQGLVRPAERF